MLTKQNIRSRDFFSGDLADIYPKEVPAEVTHQVYRDNLRAACFSNDGQVSVLELGCGTGRYFDFLHNVKRLVGVDISKDMLAFAKETVRKRPDLDGVTSLVQSSIEDFNTEEKFDFVYSIGTLGEFCEFSPDVMKRMLSTLKPGGFLFFTIVDADSFSKTRYSRFQLLVNAITRRILPFKHRFRFSPQELVLSDWKNLFLTRKEVEQVITSVDIPVRFELSRSKDNVHVHHICKVWLERKLKMLMAYFYLSGEAVAECLAPELLML
ncbi:MAG: class I SAM-dependent methyltransferase [Chitinophagales bacterium]|nr:class I SAM-dependent methyltransferase [Chitinophagales bacterium]